MTKKYEIEYEIEKSNYVYFKYKPYPTDPQLPPGEVIIKYNGLASGNLVDTKVVKIISDGGGAFVFRDDSYTHLFKGRMGVFIDKEDDGMTRKYTVPEIDIIPILFNRTDNLSFHDLKPQDSDTIAYYIMGDFDSDDDAISTLELYSQVH